ncbi:MAG: hypothetical protein Q8R04_04205 [Nanoarchaeota archaeon]|nr:hypothetical protein [Nanoarchaeota archaeon]
MDFAIALLLFTFTLVVYFSYTTNFQKQEQGDLNAMLTDAKAISSSLTLSGYPNDWDNITVVRIGMADEQKLNESKMRHFSELEYNDTKRRFATIYDYFVFLEGENKSLINFGTKCGVGNSSINVTKKFKRAGYFRQAELQMEDEIDRLEAKLGIDIYRDWASASALLINISKYNFVLLETPRLSSSQAEELNTYVNNGGFVFVSERIITKENDIVLGVNYTKRVACNQDATVILDDLFLTLKKGDKFEPAECPYIEGPVTKIAEFPDGKIAIAKWNYGKGNVYFFSDFDIQYLPSLQQNVADAIEASITDCGASDDIQANKTNAKRFVKIERFLTYNSRIVKMVVYLWQ